MSDVMNDPNKRRMSRRGFLQWAAQRSAVIAVGGLGTSLACLSQVRADASDGPGVPVLAYHPDFSEEWTAAAFRQQMRTIHDLRLRAISFRALRWYLENGGAPRGCVVLTIDDVGAAKGCCDREGNLAGPYANFWLHMYPELCRYGFQAALSVVTGGIPEEADGWDWRKIRFLQQMGHELASHSVSHSYEMVGRNGTLSREDAVREFAESKATIAAKCGVEPIAYVWPFNAVIFKAEAAALYPVLVTYGEGGAVQTRAQLSAVPRYHAELHQGSSFMELMLPFETDAHRRYMRPRSRRAEITYVVQSGDVLERIALRHNTTVAAIVEANHYRYPNLDSGLIFPNMQLLIPTGRRFYGGP
jgi:peptidoglycan/xylan/chitin deacetylase (PgdA/CDA1 family)